MPFKCVKIKIRDGIVVQLTVQVSSTRVGKFIIGRRKK
jgi:hypothetical protein